LKSRQAKDVVQITPAFQKAQKAFTKFQDELRPRLIKQERLHTELHDIANRALQETREELQYLPSVSDGPNVTALKDKIRLQIDERLNRLKEKMQQASSQIRLSKNEINEGWTKGKDLEQNVATLERFQQTAQLLSNYALQTANVNALSHTTSDADGKFTVLIPPKSIIYAFASRRADSNVENYCWLVNPVTDGALMLTNRNTIDSSAEENFAVSTKATISGSRRTIIGSSKPELDNILAGWPSGLNGQSTDTRPVYYYIADVELIVSFSEQKAVGVAVVASGASSISENRFQELILMIDGAESTQANIARDASGIRGFTVGDVR
jgi:hypothetical protein